MTSAHIPSLRALPSAMDFLSLTAIGIGRPYIWGLASFGQEGVERVLDILRAELSIAMRQAGTRSIAEINRSYVVDKRLG